MPWACLDPALSAVLLRLPSAALVADGNRRCVFANPAAASLLETPVDQLVGKRTDECTPVGLLVDAEWDRLLRSGEMQISLGIETAPGQRKYIEFTALANIEPDLHLILLRDITPERAVDIQKMQVAEVAELALNAAQMGCWSWNILTGTTTCNKAFQSLFGMDSAEADTPYQDFLDRIHPDDRESLRQLLSVTLRSGERYDTIYRVVCSDSTIRWIRDRGEVLFDDDKTRIGISGVAWDTTKQRLLEQERQNYIRELAQSNVDLQRFAHVASHDLKEPLRNISALTDLLARQAGGKLNQDEREILQMIVGSARRMATLIDSMLAYAKTGLKRKLILSTTAACAVVDDALSNLRLAIEQSAAEIEVGDLPVISCARLDLAQVFQNLIGNAIKYCARKPQIRISAERVNSGWQFAIRDNGIGIEPAHREDIFEMFTRLHADVYPGTGAGLAICKAIIEKHGGRIWVDSEPQKGSTFFFTLPF